MSKRNHGATLMDIQMDLNHERVETTLIYAFADLLHEAENSAEFVRYALPEGKVPQAPSLPPTSAKASEALGHAKA